MAAQPWTTKEYEIIRAHASLGADALAIELGRSRRSVVCKASDLGVSLRKERSRKGLRLGQPRTTKLTAVVKDPAFLEAIADGKTLTELTQALAEDVKGGTELCPRCVARPIRHKSTGLCTVCHFKGLAQQWRERNAEQEAKAEYYRERERGKRRTVCTSCGDSYSPRLDREGRKSDRNVCPKCREKVPA